MDVQLTAAATAATAAADSRPSTPDTDASSSSSSSDQSTAAAAAAPDNALIKQQQQRQSLRRQQRFHDIMDGCSMTLSTITLALAVTLCALTLNIPGLTWAGVVLLGSIIAPPVVVGSLILARNHWLVVALRYCLSVAALQGDVGVSFMCFRSSYVKAALSGISKVFLTLFGFVVALYLTACYVVTAVLSVPLLDLALCVSLVPWIRKKFISQDLVFLESYKPARKLAAALLQAVPLTVITFVLLLAAAAPVQPGCQVIAAAAAGGNAITGYNCVSGTSVTAVNVNGSSSAAAAAGSSVTTGSSGGSSGNMVEYNEGSNQGARKLLWHRSLAAAAAAAGATSIGDNSSSSSGDKSEGSLNQVVSEAVERSNKAASTVAAIMSVGSNGSSSSSTAAAPQHNAPTVHVIAKKNAQGVVHVDIITPAFGPPTAAGSSSDGSSSSSTIFGSSSSGGYVVFPRRVSRSSSSSNFFVLLAPNWGLITSSVRQLPVEILYCCVIFGGLEVVLTLLLLLLGCKKARVGFWRHMGLILRLKGGLRVPDFVAYEALQHIRRDGGRRLHLSNVWYWSNNNNNNNNSTRDVGKIPLVPRYLFPPDGGWLVPGQLCHLAALSFNALSSSSSSDVSAAAAAVEILEIDHASSRDLCALLSGAVDHLPQLKTLQLNWCFIGGHSLPHQLLHCKTLKAVTLNRCEISDPGAIMINTLISSPSCQIKTLLVMKCHIGSEGVRVLGEAIAESNNLESVRFTGNQGGKTAAEAFAAAVRNSSSSSLTHLNIAFNKLTPSGGDALAAALTDIAAAGSSSGSSSSLQRLILQRKEVGGAGLKALIHAFRKITCYDGKLTLKVLQGSGSRRTGSGSGGQGVAPCILHFLELPVLFVCHDDNETLVSEDWLTENLKSLNKFMPAQRQQQQDITAAAAAAAEHTTLVISDSDNVVDIQETCKRNDIAADKDQSCPAKLSGSCSSLSSLACCTSTAATAAAAAASPTRPLINLKQAPSSSSDGPTPAGSTADAISQTIIAAAAAAATAAAGSSSSSVWCPQLIFLSQNDPCDTIAAVTKHIEGLEVLDLNGLHLGNKGVKTISSALSEAAGLQQLLLSNTGIIEESAAAALAAALKKAGKSTPTAAAAAATAVDVAHTSMISSSSSSSVTPGHVAVDIDSSRQQQQQQVASEQSTAAAAAAVTTVRSSQLTVLDLSYNTICDAGAMAVVEAVRAGACPNLTLLRIANNRYPFDWSTILNLQKLEIEQPGLQVVLGAPSSWCVNPANVSAAAAAAAGALTGSSTDITISSSSSNVASSICSEDLCGVCFDAPNSLIIQDCNHRLCTGCYKQLIKASANSSSSSSRQQQQGRNAGAGSSAACPFCRQPMSGFLYSAWL